MEESLNYEIHESVTEKSYSCEISEPVWVQRLFEIQNNTSAGVLMGFPGQGHGDRCLYCDQYDRCLDFAAVRDWSGFNCRNCSYYQKGRYDFCFEMFADLANEAEDALGDEQIYYFNESEIQHLIDYPNDQEDLLIMQIDREALNEN